MQGDIERILLSTATIAARLDELAATITADLERATGIAEDSDPHNTLTLVPVMTGSIIFVADLVRRLPIRMQIFPMSASSYPGTATESQGKVELSDLSRLPDDLSGHHVLLVDDIDFLDAKMVIQEDFLHTFKQLESRGCQIILTSDRHPRLLTKTSTELTTRFISGLVCKIEAPNRETRFEILKHKSRLIHAELSDSVLEFVAQKFQHNVRELEGALNCLETHRSFATNKRLSVSSARKILSDLERDCIQVVRSTDVEMLVCEFFGITVDELKSSSRSRQISIPRMIAIYLTRKHTEAAYKEIGQQFGGRNHSTIMSAEKKVRKFLKDDATIKIANREWPARDLIESLERQLMAA